MDWRVAHPFAVSALRLHQNKLIGWPILCVLCKGWAFLLPDAVSSSFPFPRRNPRAPEPALSVVEGFAPHSGPPTAGYPDFGALPWATATGAIRSEPG